MSAVKGTLKNGQIVLDEPADWPDDCRVLVKLVVGSDDEIGGAGREWPTDPEGIARHLALMDQIEDGPILTPEEEAAWRAALADQKAFQLATWDERCRKIEKMFE